ncbi:hypothetical protein BDK92_5362 [Micromonospora pisi]|uniref:PH (Pleckstrin Homology) domain-containing protein n=1 Tax=Micromonospora pisi TaxID=589240 RepID=A0A495JR22_9ACTN|nr:hypothetical protein [Micromonospora pisi]RKR90978.1 hypothetical protein BDK92_5362 [Micromonospora pisi]
MRAATRPGGEQDGKHQLVVLASFRPTWRQALLNGLWAGVVGTITLTSAVLTGPTVLAVLVGGTWQLRAPTQASWLAVLAPLPLGLIYGVAIRRRIGARLDELGVRSVPLGLDGFAPWRLVVDIRAERRRGRTLVAVYLHNGATLRLRAPYDGWLGRDPRFERKLFLICHVWSTHRDWLVPGLAPEPRPGEGSVPDGPPGP